MAPFFSSISNSPLSLRTTWPHSKDDMRGMLAVNPGDAELARDSISLPPCRPRHLPERKRSASTPPRPGVAHGRTARVSTRDQREDRIVSDEPTPFTIVSQ